MTAPPPAGNRAANVLVGKPLVTGGLLVGPLGTTLPTSTATALDAAITAVGYVSEDGVTQTIDAGTQDIVAWGGDTVRTIQSDHKVSFQFKLLETNELSLRTYYGDANVTKNATTNEIAARLKAGDLPHKSWIIEVRDGERDVRVVIPDGQVTDRGDLTYVHNDAVMYDLTLTAYPDSSGVKAYVYSESLTP